MAASALADRSGRPPESEGRRAAIRFRSLWLAGGAATALSRELTFAGALCQTGAAGDGSRAGRGLDHRGQPPRI